MAEKRSRRPAIPSPELDAVFSAVSHSSRRQILASLCARGGRMTAGAIADRFKCSWPTTTRHLKVLREAGVLQVDRDGRHRVYRLQPATLRRAAGWLSDLADRVDRAAEHDAHAEARAGGYATMRNAVPPD